MAVFPIGYVSITTGLSAHVLRAWERRYQAIQPGRSASGRRLYSQEDIDRLVLLKRAVAKGNSISRIAGLDDATLAGLAGLLPEPPLANRKSAQPSAGAPKERIQDVIANCRQAMEDLDDSRLFQTLQHAMLSHSRQSIIDGIIVPFMADIGRRWSKGSLRIVHEHLASSVVHAYLSGMLTRRNVGSAPTPRLMIATPTGQSCFLGAMAIAVTAQDQGWEPVFLGPDLPCEEIAAARLALDPQLIALSITCRTNDVFIESELKRLASLLQGSCPFIVGGFAADVHRQSIEAAGGQCCPTAEGLIDHFARPTAIDV